jgi:DNA polymerase III epsilon subunit-like protein
MPLKGHDMYSSVHLNGHLLCSGDCETAGLNVKRHDLLQVAIVPLRPDLTVSKELPFFEMKLKPKRDWDYYLRLKEWDSEVKISKARFIDHQLNGVEADFAADLFETWFRKLTLPERKGLAIVGCNWDNFDKIFLQEWLGELAYAHFFRQTRDIQKAALFLNDVADFENQPYPFPKTRLSFMCKRLGVVNDKPHDALADALATAEVYRQLMRQPLRVFRVVESGNPGKPSDSQSTPSGNDKTLSPGHMEVCVIPAAETGKAPVSDCAQTDHPDSPHTPPEATEGTLA